MSMDTGPTHPLFKSMRKGMGRLVWRGARADNATHRSSVGNGLAVDKRVSHGSLPIFAHYVTRWSLPLILNGMKVKKHKR